MRSVGSRLLGSLVLLLSGLASFTVLGQTNPPQPAIRVVMDNNYPPYVFKNNDGKLEGIVIDQWRLWERTTGIKVEIHAMDWNAALQQMRAGKYDVIDTIFKTAARTNFFDFTRPYARIQVPIFFRRGISGIKDLASLQGFPVAAKDGDAAVDLLKANDIKPLLLFKNYEAIVSAAKEHKISVFVVDEPPALYFLSKMGIDNQFRMTAPISIGEFHRAVRRGNTNLLRQIENGFAEVGQPALDRINKQWLGRAIPGSRYLAYVKWITLALVLLATLLAGWNWTLSRLVRKRTLTLQASEARLRASDERLRSILDGMFAVVGLLTANGILQDCNHALLAAIGKRKEKIIGQPFADGEWFSHSAETQAQVRSLINRAATGKEAREDIVLRMATGDIVDLDASFNAYHDASGRVTQIVVSGINITQRKLAQQALIESESRFRAIVESEPECVKVVSPDGRLMEMNPAGLAMLECKTLQQVQERPLSDWVAEAYREGFARFHQRILQGETGTYLFEVIGRSGTHRWLETHAVPLRDAAGKIVSLLGVTRDITERKQAEERIRHLNRVYAVLSDINQVIVREEDSEKILETACRIAVDKGKFQMAWIGRARPADDHIEVAAHAGATEDTLQLLSLLVCGNRPDCYFTYTALHSGRHCVCNDIARDSRSVSWRAEALRRNYQSMVSLPLLVRSEVVGTFNLYSAEPGFFDEEELRLLDELATDVAYALEICQRQKEQRLAEQRNARQRNELISLASQRPQTGDGLEPKLRQIVEAAARTLDVARVGIWRYSEDHSSIVCTNLFERETGRHSSGLALAAAKYPTYFRALAETKVIAADDALADARTAEFADDRLRPLGIISLLDVPINVGGKLDGVLCHGHTGTKRQWSADEKTFAVAMANLVSLALEGDDRRQAETALRASEERFRELAETIQEVFWITEPGKFQMLYISPAYEKIWGRSVASLHQNPQSWLEAIHPDDRASVLHAVKTKQMDGNYDEEYRILRPDGAVRWIRDCAFPVRNATGQVERIIGVARDITDRKVAEDNLRQSQKMEGIGQLAGGVAHDFNNVLATIIMQADLVALPKNLPAEVQEGLKQIKASAERAASLTRQLLLFSRKQIIQLKLLDLNEAVTTLAKMLQRLIGEDVQLCLRLHPAPLIVRADAGMLDQVIMNLAINARDAMSTGGQLVIETSNVIVERNGVGQNPDARPGTYVCLNVIDTGTGIAPEIMPRIFEPFFTTKEAGKGTGLGLATVFGIIKQHRGWITVHSEPDKGANFQIFLPKHETPVKQTNVDVAQGRPQGGTEIILLVEDENHVRILTRNILQRYGYRVLEAADGVQALQIWENTRDQVALLFTDMVMPGGINGRELARRLQSEKPGLKVVYTSGYSADIAGKELKLLPGENFIAKPSSYLQLLEIIRRSLDK